MWISHSSTNIISRMVGVAGFFLLPEKQYSNLDFAIDRVLIDVLHVIFFSSARGGDRGTEWCQASPNRHKYNGFSIVRPKIFLGLYSMAPFNGSKKSYLLPLSSAMVVKNNNDCVTTMC